MAGSTATPSAALSPESPEVKRLVQTALASLEGLPRDERLGARCLSALAFIKANRPKHPWVGQTVTDCLDLIDDAEQLEKLDNYSFGLAIILLCEDRTRDHSAVVRRYLEEASERQKEHGGWGYTYSSTGDTSQTQYLALALWAAHARGQTVPATVHSGLVEWLLRTQDPSGGWGYQGQLGSFDARVPQSKVTCTLTSAAISSLMIAADMSGRLQGAPPAKRRERGPTKPNGRRPLDLNDLPPGVSLAVNRREENDAQRIDVAGKKRVTGSKVNWGNVFEAIDFGNEWMKAYFELPAREYPNYYLYTLERYYSFRDYRRGYIDPEPSWYKAGYDALVSSQRSPGVWNAGCKPEADTAFAVLFLLRSTQKSIRVGIGEGLLTSGRGLPENVVGAQLVGGRVVPQLDVEDMAGVLALVDGDRADLLDAIATNPDAIELSNIGPDDLRRLKQLLRGESADARVIAADALGRLGELDSVPDLVYALTDPDKRVVLAARDGLRAISRRSQGFGLPDDYNENERFQAIERWKDWYKALEPNAIFD